MSQPSAPIPDPPSYVVLGHSSERGLAFEVELYLARNYVCVGGLAIGRDGRYHQALMQRQTGTAPVARYQSTREAA